MKHKDGVGKPGNVENAKYPAFIPDPYLADSGPDRGHRLPIVRIAPSLQKIELLTGPSSRGLRKAPESVKRISTKLDRLAITHLSCLYNVLYVPVKAVL